MNYKEDSYTAPSGAASVVTSGADRLLLWVVLSLAVLFLCAIVIWPHQAAVYNQEGGLIETLSALALIAAGLVALFKYRGITRAYIGLVCLLLAERELDADVHAAGSLLYKIHSSLDTTLDATAVRIVLALIVIGGVLWHGIPNGWRAIKQRAPFLLVFLLAGTIAVIAQGLEEVSGFFKGSLSFTMLTRLFVLEETLEMYFSVGILAAVLIGWPKSKTEEIPDDLDRKPDAR